METSLFDFLHPGFNLNSDFLTCNWVNGGVIPLVGNIVFKRFFCFYLNLTSPKNDPVTSKNPYYEQLINSFLKVPKRLLKV